MKSLTINISDNKNSEALINFLKSFDYIEIKPKNELTAKQEHEELKKVMLTSTKKFISNILLKDEN